MNEYGSLTQKIKYAVWGHSVAVPSGAVYLTRVLGRHTLFITVASSCLAAFPTPPPIE